MQVNVVRLEELSQRTPQVVCELLNLFLQFLQSLSQHHELCLGILSLLGCGIALTLRGAGNKSV